MTKRSFLATFVDHSSKKQRVYTGKVSLSCYIDRLQGELLLSFSPPPPCRNLPEVNPGERTDPSWANSQGWSHRCSLKWGSTVDINRMDQITFKSQYTLDFLTMFHGNYFGEFVTLWKFFTRLLLLTFSFSSSFSSRNLGLLINSILRKLWNTINT